MTDELLIAALAGLVLLLAIWFYWTRRDIPLNWPNHETCRHCGGLLLPRGYAIVFCAACECAFDTNNLTVAYRGEGCPGA